MSDPDSGPTTCILFVAHSLAEGCLAAYRKLKSDCAGSPYRVHFLFDNTRGDFDARCFEDSTDCYLFDRARMASRFDLYSCSPEGGVCPGNSTFAVLLFYLDHPHYLHYWRLEYDVFYQGRWSECFDQLEASDADLLTTTLFRPGVRPDWPWWKSLRTPALVPHPVEPIRGFLPIARLSRAACETLDRAFRSGWAGHDEVAVPTIIGACGLRLEDIGGAGEFVKPGNENRMYTNTPSVGGLAPGTFVWRPQVAPVLYQPGKLYHPVR